MPEELACELKSGTNGGTFGMAAYGGAGWVPRAKPHQAELGGLWAPYAVDSEWRRLTCCSAARTGARTGAERLLTLKVP